MAETEQKKIRWKNIDGCVLNGAENLNETKNDTTFFFLGDEEWKMEHGKWNMENEVVICAF